MSACGVGAYCTVANTSPVHPPPSASARRAAQYGLPQLTPIPASKLYLYPGKRFWAIDGGHRAVSLVRIMTDPTEEDKRKGFIKGRYLLPCHIVTGLSDAKQRQLSKGEGAPRRASPGTPIL